MGDGRGRKRVGILISGRGSNMMSLVAATKQPDYPADVVCVISNRPQAPGLAWAKAQGLPAFGLDHKAFQDRAAFEAEMQEILLAHHCDLVACCGFLRLMTAEFVNLWHDRMLNIHPALLPSYRGLHTHERALADGVRIAGCTVHVVRAEMDVGPIIGQAAVPVRDDDTPDSLAARILHAEHALYPHALQLFASGKVRIVNERVTGADGAALATPVMMSPPLAVANN